MAESTSSSEQALYRITRAYKALSMCNQILMRATDEVTLLNEICRVITEVGGYRLAWVGFAQDDEARSVRPVAWAGYAQSYLDTLDITWNPTERGRGPSGTAIRSGQPVVVRHIPTDPDFEPWRAAALEHGYGSAVALPLLIEGQVIGALHVYAGEPDAFDEEEIGLLVELAGDLAYGIAALRTRVAHEQAEMALRESQRTLLTLMSNLPGMAYRCRNDPDWTMEFVSEGCLALTGYHPEDLVGNRRVSYAQLIHPEDREAVWEAVQAALREDSAFQISYRLIAADGAEKWVWEQGRGVRGAGGVYAILEGFITDVTEQRQMQEALRQERDLLDRIMDTSPVGIVVVSREGDVQFANACCQQLLGMSRDELTRRVFGGAGWRITDLNGQSLPPEQLPFWQVIHTGQPVWNREHAFIRPDGQRVFLSINASPIADADGRVHSVVATLRDITAYVRAEQAEREQRALAEALHDTAALLSSTLDLEEVLTRILDSIGRVVPHEAASVLLVEDGVARVVGRRGYEERGLKEEVPGAQVRVEEVRHLAHMAQSGKPLVIPDVQGEPAWAELLEMGWVRSYVGAPIRFKGLAIGFLSLHNSRPGFYTEEHARHLQAFADQAATALDNARLYDAIRRYALYLEEGVVARIKEVQQTRERVEAILNSTGDAIVLVERDGIIRQVNPAFDRMFGYAPDEPFGQPLAMLVDPEHRETLMAALRTAVNEQQSSRVELVVRRKDGTLFDADVSLSPIKDPLSVELPWGAVCSLRDITMRKQMEAELRGALERERELGELKSRFISMASHEFRTPLATIISSAGLLEMGAGKMSAERRLHHLKKIQTSASHIAQLLEEVLLIGKAEAGRLDFNPVPLDLERLCRDVLEEVAVLSSATHELRFSFEGACSQAWVDEKLVRHILTNLLSNAVKYSPEGSPVHLDLVCTEDAVIFRVRDRGMGIPAADQARIFEPFHRAKNVGHVPGTGLGLAIARRAAEQHGGSIRFESQIGKGTTFTVTLPRHPA